MRTIQASEAKAKFLSLLDEIEQGETIVITRRGKTVARITPETEIESDRVQRAIDGMRKLRKTAGRLSLGDSVGAR